MTNLRSYLDEHGGLLPWSYTKLNMAKCPYQSEKMIAAGFGSDFKGNIICGMENLEAGIAIHELLEMWHLHFCIDGDLVEPGEILCTKSIPIGEWLPLIEEYNRAKDFFAYKLGVPQFSGGEVRGVEVVLALDKDGVQIPANIAMRKPYAYIKGTLDLLQIEGGTATITDYKRQWNVLSRTDLNNNFQMMLYSYLVACAYPEVNQVAVRMYFTRHGYVQEIVREVPEIMKVKPVIDQLVHGLTANLKKYADDPIPSPGDHCNVCRFVRSCPISENIELVPRIKTQDEAKKVASELSLRKIRVKSSTDRLKDWTSEFGPVVSDDGKMVYGYTASSSDSWEITNMDELLRIMLREQISVGDILAPDSSKLKGFIKQIKNNNPELFESMLKTCLKKKITTSFREVKNK